MNTYQIDKAIEAIARLTQETQLPECYKNDIAIDERTLLKGDVSQEFGFVLRTCGTFLDNPSYPLGTEYQPDNYVIQTRHRILGGGTIRYFWYTQEHFTEVTLEDYCMLFAVASIEYCVKEVRV